MNITSLIGKTAFVISTLHTVVNNASATNIGVVKDAFILNKGTKDAKIVLKVGEWTLTFDPIDTVDFSEDRISFPICLDIGFELKVFAITFA